MLNKRGEHFGEPAEAGTSYRTLDSGAFEGNATSGILPQYVDWINMAIEENPKNPMLDRKPLSEYLLDLRHSDPSLSEDELRFLDRAMRTIQPVDHPDITDDEPDYREAAHARNLDNGTGRPAVEVRHMSGGVAHEATRYPHAPTLHEAPKPLRKKPVLVDPEPSMPNTGQWSAENLDRLQEWSAPIRQQVEESAFERRVEALMRAHKVLSRADAEEKVRLQDAARRVSQQARRSA